MKIYWYDNNVQCITCVLCYIIKIITKLKCEQTHARLIADNNNNVVLNCVFVVLEIQKGRWKLKQCSNEYVCLEFGLNIC